MSKYDFSRISKLILRYHNLQINRELRKKDLKNTRKNIYKDLLIKNTDTAQLIILKILFFWLSNGNLERITKAVLSIPQGWAVKPGDFIPQLIIIYRIKGNSSTGNYDIAVPHYNGAKSPVLPTYSKGSNRTAWVLADGTSIIINAATEAEGERVMNQLRRYIPKKFQTKDIRHTKNQRVKRDEMELIRCDFYPNGQGRSEPLWRHYF